ncbi:MAG TPA: cupin domain-containing protein [Pseudacidobacterium sp.]|nr:cupin domain-containing protein [Pseudacidobacterium sp.]
MSKIKVVREKNILPSVPEPGLFRQVLAYNPNLMLVRHQMEKGWQGALHSHPHDQLVYVISGRLRFLGGKSDFEIAAGDSFVVPGGVEHQAEALEKSEVLDVFTPYREDYAPEKE